MNTMFIRDDLRAGYIVKLRNCELRAVHPVGKTGTLILTNGGAEWDYLSWWSQDLTARSEKHTLGFPSKKAYEMAHDKDIVAVYGWVNGTENYRHAGVISTVNRPVLWTRQEIKKMTLSEVCEKLGYPIELVPED